MKEEAVKCMNCNIILFTLLVKEDGGNICYQSNCPVCGGKSFKKRVGVALVNSENFIITDAETKIDITLEKK